MLPSLLTCLKDLMRFAISVSAKTKSLCRAESEWLAFLRRDLRGSLPIDDHGTRKSKFENRNSSPLGCSSGFSKFRISSFEFRMSAIENPQSASSVPLKLKHRAYGASQWSLC